jgi:uncharacterized membrane protein
MQCPVCHNEVQPQAAFCNHCGANLAAAVPPATPSDATYTAPAASAVPPVEYAPPPVAGSPGLSANAASAIAYITFIPAIIFLIMEPYNRIPLVRFHSFQSIGLAVVWVALRILFLFLIFFPFLHLIFFFVEACVFFGLFIVWLITLLKASRGEWFKLPIIGDLALKQAQS